MFVAAMNTDSMSASLSLESLPCSLSDSDSEKGLDEFMRLNDGGDYDVVVDKFGQQHRNNDNSTFSSLVFADGTEACNRIYDALYSGHGTFSIYSPLNQVALSIFWLLFWPWIHLNGEIPINSITAFVNTIRNFYDGGFAISCYLLGGFSMFISLYHGHKWYEQKMRRYNSKHNGNLSEDKDDEIDVSTFRSVRSDFTCTKLGTTAGDGIGFVFFFFMINMLFIAHLSSSVPSFGWHPFLFWPGVYKIYHPEKVAESLDSLCLDYVSWEKEYRTPLCLSEKSWNALSGGVLSSKNDDDVATVLKGVDYIQHKSGGIVFNTMCRDCVDKIPTFRRNIENLQPFIPHFTVVIFENDSQDGSREAFKAWAIEAKGYTIDLMECEEAVDCIFNTRHRYDEHEELEFAFTSAIGPMADFRNRMMDYVQNKKEYNDYSHVIVYDMDLIVSLSPLGIIHSIGGMPDNPIAARGMMPFPGSFGTITYPYDLSAYVPFPTNQNKRLIQIHDMVCDGLSEPGHRWRNICKVASPVLLMMALEDDRTDQDFVKVKSAYNGGAIYPLDQIRRLHPKYSGGDDGQICEHISFANDFEQPMYINRKWRFNLKPSGGGPSGDALVRSGNVIITRPLIGVPVMFQRLLFVLPFIIAVNRITMFLIYPMFFRNFFVCLQAYRFLAMFYTAKIISCWRGKKRKRTSSIDR